eukprot:2696983-Amphidinium_carterae.1
MERLPTQAWPNRRHGLISPWIASCCVNFGRCTASPFAHLWLHAAADAFSLRRVQQCRVQSVAPPTSPFAPLVQGRRGSFQYPPSQSTSKTMLVDGLASDSLSLEEALRRPFFVQVLAMHIASAPNREHNYKTVAPLSLKAKHF